MDDKARKLIGLLIKHTASSVTPFPIPAIVEFLIDEVVEGQRLARQWGEQSKAHKQALETLIVTPFKVGETNREMRVVRPPSGCSVSY